MVSPLTIQLLTVFTLILSILLLGINRKTRGGSKGFLYFFYGILLWWVGNLGSFLISLSGYAFYEAFRVIFLNISTMIMVFALIVLGKDYGALKFGMDLRKSARLAFSEIAVLFAILVSMYVYGMIDPLQFELLGRLNQMFIILAGIYYCMRIMVAIRYQKHWIMLSMVAFGILMLIISRIVGIYTGIDVTLYDNIAFVIICVCFLGGFAMMARHLRVF